jgi:hypothetical protein
MSKQLKASRVRLTELGVNEANLVPSYVLMSVLVCFEEIQKVFVVGDAALLHPLRSKTDYDVEYVFTAIEHTYVDAFGKVKVLKSQFRMPSVHGLHLKCCEDPPLPPMQPYDARMQTREIGMLQLYDIRLV